MRTFIGATTITIALTLSAGSAQPQTSESTFFVSANMDIYRAGGYNDGSNGVAPFSYSFPAGLRQALTFSKIAGIWTCADGTANSAPWGPDGTLATMGNHCYGFGANILSPVGPFSGFEATDFSGALVGMFLEDSLPTIPPRPLRFYFTQSSVGAIPTDFKILFPLIGQVFFIGDGLTGTGSGQHQVFSVPPTATHLYLGYIDSCSTAGPTFPGCFSDNAGAVVATFHISQL